MIVPGRNKRCPYRRAGCPVCRGFVLRRFGEPLLFLVPGLGALAVSAAPWAQNASPASRRDANAFAIEKRPPTYMRGATPSFLQPKPVAKKRAAVNTAYAREKAMKFKMNGFKRVLSCRRTGAGNHDVGARRTLIPGARRCRYRSGRASRRCGATCRRGSADCSRWVNVGFGVGHDG
jgi:hypothetical protein